MIWSNLSKPKPIEKFSFEAFIVKHVLILPCLVLTGQQKEMQILPFFKSISALDCSFTLLTFLALNVGCTHVEIDQIFVSTSFKHASKAVP